MEYVVRFDVRTQGGRYVGGGIARVQSDNEADAERFVIADQRASFGMPRGRITASASLPAPQCPLCRHWHERTNVPAACCGCKS